MNIIPESVSFRPSSPRPPSSSRPFVEVANVLLLAAPPVRLALPAPRGVPIRLLAAPPIAGLLSAGRPLQQTAKPHPQDYLIIEKRLTLDDIMTQIAQMGPFQTIEEADAEIAAIHEFYERRRQRIIEDHLARRRAKEQQS